MLHLKTCTQNKFVIPTKTLSVPVLQFFQVPPPPPKKNVTTIQEASYKVMLHVEQTQIYFWVILYSVKYIYGNIQNRNKRLFTELIVNNICNKCSLGHQLQQDNSNTLCQQYLTLLVLCLFIYASPVINKTNLWQHLLAQGLNNFLFLLRKSKWGEFIILFLFFI